MLTTALIFQDHMILQRDKQIAIWGISDPGAQITVTMQGQTGTATADISGAWKAVCGPFSTSFSETLVIASGEESLRFQDVQVGEVWLAGGAVQHGVSYAV